LSTVILLVTYVVVSVAAQAFAGIGDTGIGLTNPETIDDPFTGIGHAALGAWGEHTGRPPTLARVHWASGSLAAMAAMAGLGWIVSRDRLLPRRRVRAEEVLAGHTAALLALGVVGLLVVATDPFALVFLLPCLHVWLWLPQVHSRGRWARAIVLLAGLIGPALVVWSFAGRYGLGWDAPWYVVQLFAAGYAPVPLLAIGLAWLAAAGQLVALAAGRYAAYPAVHERSPRGPIRETIRRAVLARRRRGAVLEERRRAFPG